MVKNECMVCGKNNLNNNNNNNNKNIEIICEKCFDVSQYIRMEKYEINQVNKIKDTKKLYIKKNNNCDNILIPEKIERKQSLVKKMADFKLNYEKYKDNTLCKSYINFGTPNLDTIIENICSKLSIENNRLCELLEKLKELNLEYDSTIPSYKKFIKKGGDIKKIINSAELEKDLIKDTNYLSLYDMTDSDTAKEMVISKVEVKTKRVEKYILKKNTIKFD